MTGARTLAELSERYAREQEEVIDPGLPIIDAHVHHWWRPPQAYQGSEFAADTACGHDIRASVFVQCTAMYRDTGPDHLRPVGETEYINGIAAIGASGLFGTLRPCAGIVGYADLTGDRVEEVLAAHLKAAGTRFKGIRQQFQWDALVGSFAKTSPPRDLVQSPRFAEGLHTLGRMGLRFDAWCFFHQLDDLAQVADRVPDTAIVLNHVGGPLGCGPYASHRDEVFSAWADAIGRLARRPQIFVKIGGLGMQSLGLGFDELDRAPSSVVLANAWRPYVETCIAAFGPERCMFESNFPVDKQTCSYRVLWNAFKRTVSGASDDERRALFAGTAKRAYALDDIDI